MSISDEEVEAAAAGMWGACGREVAVPWVEAVARSAGSLIGAEVSYTRRMAYAALSAAAKVRAGREGEDVTGVDGRRMLDVSYMGKGAHIGSGPPKRRLTYNMKDVTGAIIAAAKNNGLAMTYGDVADIATAVIAALSTQEGK